MVQNHGVSINAQVARKEDNPMIGCLHRIMFGDGQIESQVVLGVDNLSVISVLAVVGKGSLQLRPGQLPEGPLPEQFLPAFF